MLIRFWCDSDFTFSRGLHKNLVTVLYLSIINVLCGAGGDASFAPQANLVWTIFTCFFLVYAHPKDGCTCHWLTQCSGYVQKMQCAFPRTIYYFYAVGCNATYVCEIFVINQRQCH